MTKAEWPQRATPTQELNALTRNDLNQQEGTLLGCLSNGLNAHLPCAFH